MMTTTPEIPLAPNDPAVRAAAFAVGEYGNGPDISPEHIISAVAFLQTEGHTDTMLAALTGRAYAVLRQEFGKVIH